MRRSGWSRSCPRPPANPLGVPDMMFVRPTVVLIFDRLADALFLVAPVWPGGDADALIAAAAERIDADRRAARHRAAPRRRSAPSRSTSRSTPVLPRRPLCARWSRAAKDYIAAGDIFQVVLAQRFTTPFTLPPFELYRALRRVNPSPFLYHLDLPGFALTGSSPEILVRARDGEVTIRPIAGTRPRGKTAAEDEANRASLLADPKERAEHLMLLDLGRNDVGRVAEAGSVRVTDSYTVEFYSHVMHIVSNVVGKLRRRAATRSTRCSRASRPAPSAARPRSAPARSSPSWSPKRAGPMPAASAISRPTDRWTAASCCAPRW